MKTTDTLTDILQLAKTIESTVQMETLSKQLLQNVGKLNTTTEVHAVQKHHHNEENIYNQILEVPVIGNHPAGIMIKRSVVIVVISAFESNVLLMAKMFQMQEEIIIFQSFVRVQRKSQVVGLATLNVFQGKTFMKCKNQSLNKTLIMWSLSKSSSQCLCLTPEKILLTLRISCLMKCQSQRNYTEP